MRPVFTAGFEGILCVLSGETLRDSLKDFFEELMTLLDLVTSCVTLLTLVLLGVLVSFKASGDDTCLGNVSAACVVFCLCCLFRVTGWDGSVVSCDSGGDPSVIS